MVNVFDRLRVVSNFGDRDCGAGEIHTRVRMKFRGDVYFARPTIAFAKISSLRSNRFGKAFRTFDALFAFLAAGKLGWVQKVKGASNGQKALRKRLLRRLQN